MLKIKERMEQAAVTFGALGTAARLAAVVPMIMMFEERGQQFPLFDTHKSLVQLGMLGKILLCFLRGIMVLWIIEHRCTHTVLPLLAHKDLVVDAALTARPEVLILGKLRIGDRLITQLGVDLHDGQTSGKPEDLGIGIHLAAEFEDLLLDQLGQAALPEGRGDDQAGISHIFPMAPGLDIAEASPYPVVGKGNDRLAFPHLLLDVFRAPLGNTGTPGFCR